MDRSVAMLLIGLVFGGGIGFVVAASQGVALEAHDHSNPRHHGDDPADAMAHGHDDPLEIPAGTDAPTLSLAVTPDPNTGWNLHMRSTHFRFSPENVGSAHVPGEGHAHVYVNGIKVMRAYGDWVHLGTLPDGETDVRAALYTNDHRPIRVNGIPVASDVTVTAD